MKQSFTLPAAGKNVDQKRWDLAFMSRKEFMAKYEISNKEYDNLIKFVKE
jgi:hypothetical protein